jgi:hypothetical protein
MKYILIVLFLFIYTAAFSQEVKLTVSANATSLNISLDSNNANTLFVINDGRFSDNDFLTIKVDTSANKEWKRNFFIYDSLNTAIKDFVLMKDESYCIKLNNLKKLLMPDKEYFIYMMAIPKDPQKAMLVKMAKQLVCKIKIR